MPPRSRALPGFAPRVHARTFKEGAHGGTLGSPMRDAVSPQALAEVRAEESTAAGDQDPHLAGSRSGVSQSTRPIQRSRLAAYQPIVREMPSSHETFGSQPVSRLSFS